MGYANRWDKRDQRILILWIYGIQNRGTPPFLCRFAFFFNSFWTIDLVVFGQEARKRCTASDDKKTDIDKNDIQVRKLSLYSFHKWWRWWRERDDTTIIIVTTFRAFHTGVSRWFLTGVWVTTSLIKFPVLFSVFWLISTMLFGWSLLVLLFPSPQVPVPVLWWLYQEHQLRLV